MTSASMTRRDDFERSWLRSSRTVSWLASTSSVPPATNPAIRTRWNAVTSSFGWIGVSRGISKYFTPHAPEASATSATAADRLRFLFGVAAAVIDFLEELVVL